MKILTIAVLIVLYAAVATASIRAGELQPSDEFSEVSVPTPYYIELRQALLGEHKYRKCQLVAVPSFEREWAVYLVRDDAGRAELIFKALQKHLWNEMMQKLEENAGGGSYSLSDSAQSAALSKLSKNVQRISVPISSSAADLLDQVWTAMSARVRYPEEKGYGRDGTSYYLSHWQRGTGYRSGKTWSPESTSNVGMLVQIADNLRSYAMAPTLDRPRLERAIVEKAQLLLTRLRDDSR